MKLERMATNAAFRAFGTEDKATYHYGDGSTAVAGVRAVLDRDFEVFDEDQLPLRVTTICIPVATIATSQRGDTIDMAGRTWHVNRILDDDGYERRIEVT